MTLTNDDIESMAKQIYLSRYGHLGARWELVETKEFWRELAREQLVKDVDTRRGDD